MVERIGALSDHILSLLVPKTRASATVCWYETRSGPPCRRRYCCARQGHPGPPSCGSYQPC